MAMLLKRVRPETLQPQVYKAPHKRWLGAILAVAILLAAGGGYATWQAVNLPPPHRTNQDVKVVIPQGASTHAIAAMLQNAGVIRSALAFRVVARIRRADGELKPGEYAFSPADTLLTVLDKIVSGRVVTYAVTIPEGYTVAQIETELAATGLFDPQSLHVALHSQDYNFPFLPPPDPRRPEPLEGYLFPDTYFLVRGMQPQAVVEMMLREFSAQLTPADLARAAELHMSVDQVITLASIIEKEAKVESERALISSVYHNRLSIGMKLDADPTVRYALGDPARPLYRTDLSVDSPYNTYKYGGLPPGPICNPGRASITAALWPATTKYLYFVAKNDGTHAFATTYAEQLANERKYRGQ